MIVITLTTATLTKVAIGTAVGGLVGWLKHRHDKKKKVKEENK